MGSSERPKRRSSSEPSRVDTMIAGGRKAGDVHARPAGTSACTAGDVHARPAGTSAHTAGDVHARPAGTSASWSRIAHAVVLVLSTLLLAPGARALTGLGTTDIADVAIGATPMLPFPPDRFGTNFGDLPLNGWGHDTSWEPSVLRLRGVATGGGSDYLVHDTEQTTDFWQTIFDGFFDGAEVRVYRYVNNTIVKVRESTVLAYHANNYTGEYFFTFTSKGTPVAKGDVYFLSLTTNDPPVTKAHPRLTWINSKRDTWQITGPVSWLRDPSSVAPGCGRTSLRLTTWPNDTASEIRVAQYTFGYNPYPALPLGVMRFSVWLRQTGMAKPAVSFFLNSIYNVRPCTFSPTAKWTQFQCEFTNKVPSVPKNYPVVQMGLVWKGAGTLWADNFELREGKWDVPFKAPLPITVQALKDFQPSVCRVWSGIEQGGLGNSLEDWLTPDNIVPNHWSVNNGPFGGTTMHLPNALPLLQDVGCSPWLIVGVTLSETEWLGLLEYLAGPPSSPYGALRASQGRSEPWTSAFNTIYLERGNEQWNPLFGPWNDGAVEQGLWAQYFSTVLKSSPYWPAVGAKIQIILNGWVISTTYGRLAAQNCPDAGFVGVTAYTGGWELGGTIGGTAVTDEALNNTLLYAPAAQKPYTDPQAAAVSALSAGPPARARPLRLVTYEGGPSYDLPNPGKPYNDVSEIYGKSLANGVGTLDSYLYNSARGFAAQAFFLLCGGNNWCSHTAYDNPFGGFRPHASWLAMQMRNNYAKGSHVAASVLAASGVVVKDPAKNEVPNVALISVYPFKDGSNFHVMLLSRKLEGATNVTLRLPFKTAAAVLYYKLEGGPLASNLNATQVAIVSGSSLLRPVSATDGSRFSLLLPASAIHLWSFLNTTTTAALTALCTATVARGHTTGPGPASPTAITFQVAFSRPLNRSLLPSDILVTGTTGALVSAVTETDPIGFRTNFYVTLTGFLQTGGVGVKLVAGSTTTVSCGTGTKLSKVTQLQAAVKYVFPPPLNVILAYDNFTMPANSTTGYLPIHNTNMGTGWGGPWNQQAYLPADTDKVYRIVPDSSLPAPLKYKLIGGLRYLTIQRLLNFTGPLGSRYAAPGVSPVQAGARGMDLWMSFYLRKEFGDDQDLYMCLGPKPSQEWPSHVLRVGYVAPSRNASARFWGVLVQNNSYPGSLENHPVFVAFNSGVPVVTNVTRRMIVRMNWKANLTISLYIDPVFSSTASAPSSAPDLVAVVPAISAVEGNFKFRYVGFYAGNDINRGSVMSFRFADAFRALVSLG